MMEYWIVGLLGAALMTPVLGWLVFKWSKERATAREMMDSANVAWSDVSRMGLRVDGLLKNLNIANKAFDSVSALNHELRTKNHEPVMRIVLSAVDDAVLKGYMQAGPDDLVWKGVEECMRRLKDRWLSDLDSESSPEAKVAVFDQAAGLDELLTLMNQWHKAAQVRSGR